jgi:hypothetical protein
MASPACTESLCHQRAVEEGDRARWYSHKTCHHDCDEGEEVAAVVSKNLASNWRWWTSCGMGRLSAPIVYIIVCTITAMY